MYSEGAPGRLVRALNRRRSLVFFSLLGVYSALLAIQVLSHRRLLAPTAYVYLYFFTVVFFIGVIPFYRNRRLTSYYWKRTKRSWPAILGLAFIIFLVLLALIGPFFTQDPTAHVFKERNLPPVGLSIEQNTFDLATGKFATVVTPGTWKHPLGTDSDGADMLAMLVSGARISLQVGLLATGIAIFIGSVLGVLSAYMGRWIDNVLMRFTDIMLTFPFFLLLVFIVYIFGANLWIIIGVIGLTGWPGTARLVRSEALSLRTRDFILASRALGASHARIVFRHLIPNTASLIIVISTLSIPGNILAEAGLSFIGLGDPSKASWGRILNAGQNSLETAWWVAVEPGVMLLFTVLAFNFLGDGLRDAFDPRSEA
ncbi:MAG: ABC transporter permease [Chloroflexi bacterium]|nr:ABC transporter permease [Chloroflexota bacterium]